MSSLSIRLNASHVKRTEVCEDPFLAPCSGDHRFGRQLGCDCIGRTLADLDARLMTDLQSKERLFWQDSGTVVDWSLC